MIFLAYLLVGVFAGLLSGLLGVGGGLVVVPALILIFQYSKLFDPELIMHLAVGTSLAIMMLTVSSSAYAYYKRELIAWSVFVRFLPGLCLGVLAGTWLAKQLSSTILMNLFAIFLIIIALRLYFEKPAKVLNLSKNEQAPLRVPSIGLLSLAASLTGMMSAFFGIGGGLLMVPFFLYIGLNMYESSGTSSICGLPIAIISTITLTFTDSAALTHALVPAGTYGYIYWPAVGLIGIVSVLFAPLGTRLAVHTKPLILKRLMALVLILTAVNLLI